MENSSFINIEDFNSKESEKNLDKYDYIFDAMNVCANTKNCKNFEKLIPKIEELNLRISSFIGELYFNGVYFKKDINKAIYYLTKSFNQYKIIECGEILANIYIKQRKHRNYQKAFDIYTELATINHHIALTALGNFYRFGLGEIKQDLNKAKEYYKKAINSGNLTATKRLAGVYRKQGKYFKSLKTLFNKKQWQKRYQEAKKHPDGSDLFREC